MHIAECTWPLGSLSKSGLVPRPLVVDGMDSYFPFSKMAFHSCYIPSLKLLDPLLFLLYFSAELWQFRPFVRRHDGGIPITACRRVQGPSEQL